MADFNSTLQILQDAARNPSERLRHYLSEGRKVVGCFPVYTPEELAHALGMVPLGMWGGQTEWKLAKSYLPPFACPIMQSNLEFGLSGVYKGVSAVMIPTLCDTFRCVTQDWRFGVKDIPMLPITFPQNRTNPASVDFLVGEYETLVEKLSEIGGTKLTDEALSRTIDIYNRHNEVMRAFALAANEHLDVITPTVRHDIFKSAHFFEKEEHTHLMEELLDALQALPVYESKNRRILLTGIAAEPYGLLRLLEDNALDVVCDDLAQESRLYRTDVPSTDDAPLIRLALQWNARKGCSLVHEEEKSRGEMLVRMAEENAARGAIYCQMKFCDPEEFDYPICRRALEAAGVQVLMLEIDQQEASVEQASTRIQTFAEVL